MPYIRPRVISGTPSTSTKFSNAKGFNKKSDGADTVPGIDVGAPLYNSRVVDDADVKSYRYFGENGDTLGGINSIPASSGIGLHKNGQQSAPASSPVPIAGRQMPNVSSTGKPQSVATADPTSGAGVTLDSNGVLAR